jgi:HEAT repeat protein
VTVESGTTAVTLEAGFSILFQAPDRPGEKTADAFPTWLVDAGPSAAEQERGKALARYLEPARWPIIGLVEAVDDQRPEVRQDAILALGAIGKLLDLIVSTMSRKDDPAARRAAIAVLREFAVRDTESAKELRAQLELTCGVTEAGIVEKLLIGYTDLEADDETIQANLVNLLKHQDVGIRELAIEALQMISGRGDQLGYNPDNPREGPGARAWQDLMRRHEMRIPPARRVK